MALTRLSEGKLVTFDGCTAASNMSAGDLVAINCTTDIAALSTQIYSCGDTVAGVSATALLGCQFIGVLDEDVSAGDTPVRVWTEGVFEFRLASAVTTANCTVGQPLWIDSGNYLTTPGQTGEFCMGTLLSVPEQTTLTATRFTGCPYVRVRINPGALRWATWSSAQGFTGTSMPHWGAYPPVNA